MKNIIPEIYVDNCKEALEFYKSVFGGEVKNVQLADDIEMFKEYKGKIIHAELHISKDLVLYFVDNLDNLKNGNRVTLVLGMESLEEAERVFEALSEGGVVLLGLKKTFWGAYHGVVTDKFGNNFAVNYAELNK